MDILKGFSLLKNRVLFNLGKGISIKAYHVSRKLSLVVLERNDETLAGVRGKASLDFVQVVVLVLDLQIKQL